MGLLEKVSVPEGKCGEWAVERFEISKKAAAFSVLSLGHRAPLPGIYTKLVHQEHVVMSDTPAELRDHSEAVYRAQGHCLIAGLGLGLVIQAILKKPEVRSVTTVECSSEVIFLVAPHYKDPRLAIVNEDIFDWLPPEGASYDMAWFDIWSDFCADNLLEMKRLHRKFSRWAKWKGFWGREELKRKGRL